VSYREIAVINTVRVNVTHSIKNSLAIRADIFSKVSGRFAQEPIETHIAFFVRLFLRDPLLCCRSDFVLSCYKLRLLSTHRDFILGYHPIIVINIVLVYLQQSAILSGGIIRLLLSPYCEFILVLWDAQYHVNPIVYYDVMSVGSLLLSRHESLLSFNETLAI
jgi:hypothetical protein